MSAARSNYIQESFQVSINEGTKLLVLPCGIEYAIHEVPKRHKQEVSATLPGIDLNGLLIITTSQHAILDLVRMGSDIEKEKDELLEKVCQLLEGQGFWADYIDPCSGLTMRSRLNGCVYSEVDAFSTLLGYKTANAGCCKVLLHPRWGTHVYPASFFTKAPIELLQSAIKAGNELVLTQ